MTDRRMFPRNRKRPSGHLPFATGPSSSSRFNFDRETQQTRVNNFNGPQILPLYQWTPTPIRPTAPPVANSRKRQYGDYSPRHQAKRQRVETFHSDVSFKSPSRPPPPHRLLAGTSLPIPVPSPPTPAPSTPEPPSSLQLYAQDKVSAQMVELFEACQQQQSDLFEKETYRVQLEEDIQRVYPGARLYLTGSSMSGLGCRSSDADICMVLNMKKYETVITTLSTLLRLFKRLAYVDRILLIRAKVPILRFKKKR